MSNKGQSSSMEYSSPLGSNFQLGESSGSQKKDNTPDGNSLQFFASPSPDRPYNRYSYDNARGSGKRTYNRSSNYGSDQKNKWKSPNQRNWKGKPFSRSISYYYHPSMLQDPWKDLLEKRAAAE